MGEDTELHEDNPLKVAVDHLPNAPVAPAHGIAAMALGMALKYHDINTVQDGTLYQQYKLEGRNMHDLHLQDVFDTAIQMEAHLLGSSDRIAKLIFDAVMPVEDEPDGSDAPITDETAP